MTFVDDVAVACRLTVIAWVRVPITKDNHSESYIASTYLDELIISLGLRAPSQLLVIGLKLVITI